jgi:hypothetical protein
MAAPANVAQDLNNAIYSLASLNPSNPVAGRLNDAWQVWFGTARNLLPNAAWWLAFKGFWAGYAAARLSAKLLNERTPPAADIDPTLWKTLLSDVQQTDALLGDASRQAREAVRNELGELAAKATDKLKGEIRPVLFVAGLLGVGLIFATMRGVLR